MKPALVLIALIGCLLLTAIASAQEKGNDQKLSPQELQRELEPVLAAYYEAFNGKDLEKLNGFLTPDCQIRFQDGKIFSLRELRKAVAGVSENIKDSRSDFLIEKIKGNSEQAVVDLKVSESHKKKLVDGNYADVNTTRKERHWWQKTSDGWKQSLIEIRSGKTVATLNGKRMDYFRIRPEFPIPSVSPNDEDKPLLESGKAIVFMYLFNSAPLIKPPVYCNDQELVRMTGHTYVKVKLDPGTYRFRSDKGDPIELVVENRKIYFLRLEVVAGFPRGQGVLRPSDGMIGLQAYKLPTTLNLNPLKSDNIKDPSKAFTN